MISAPLLLSAYIGSIYEIPVGGGIFSYAACVDLAVFTTSLSK